MPKITLRAARVNTKMTQAEMAEKMGVSRETVFAWENGKTPMRTPYLYLFCRITGFQPDDIILPEASSLNVQEAGE